MQCIYYTFNKLKCLKLLFWTLQYCSKVSYRLLSPFLRDETLALGDETLVSQELLKQLFQNKLQAVNLRQNGEFLEMQICLPGESIWLFGLLFYMLLQEKRTYTCKKKA